MMKLMFALLVLLPLTFLSGHPLEQKKLHQPGYNYDSDPFSDSYFDSYSSVNSETINDINPDQELLSKFDRFIGKVYYSPCNDDQEVWDFVKKVKVEMLDRKLFYSEVEKFSLGVHVIIPGVTIPKKGQSYTRVDKKALYVVLNYCNVITGFALSDENRFIGTGPCGYNRLGWRLKKKKEELKEEWQNTHVCGQI